jgi:hypothetical protein
LHGKFKKDEVEYNSKKCKMDSSTLILRVEDVIDSFLAV